MTSEVAFSYLAKDYGFKEVYLWPINAEEHGSPQQVRKVIDIVRQYKIPVVFSESTISDKPARQVSKETGARYMEECFMWIHSPVKTGLYLPISICSTLQWKQ